MRRIIPYLPGVSYHGVTLSGMAKPVRFATGTVPPGSPGGAVSGRIPELKYKYRKLGTGGRFSKYGVVPKKWHWGRCFLARTNPKDHWKETVAKIKNTIGSGSERSWNAGVFILMHAPFQFLHYLGNQMGSPGQIGVGRCQLIRFRIGMERGRQKKHFKEYQFAFAKSLLLMCRSQGNLMDYSEDFKSKI